jgi:glucosylceramidase
MSHFSKFIRPGATRIGFKNTDKQLMVTAAQNPDGSIVVVLLNQQPTPKTFTLKLQKKETKIDINGESLQSIMIYPSK